MNQTSNNNHNTPKDNMFEIGKFYFLNNLYDQALDEFNKALVLDPHNAEILYNLGLVYQAKNMKTEALKMYEKALSINPDYTLARNRLNEIKGLKKNG